MKKLFRKSNEKILISFIIIIAMLSTFAIYNIFATVTIEMASQNTHDVGDSTYLSFENLRDWYDLLCSQHGTHIPSNSNATVTAGGNSSSEQSLTNNDIGKKLFTTTLGADSTTPFADGTYTNETYGYYKVSGTYKCTPMESYIMSEMINNQEYVSYVQEAWWTTEAGSFGVTVADNDLAAEARAFESYILEVAGVSSLNDLSYTNVPTKALGEKYSKYIENGIVKFEFPNIEYKPEWNQDITGENFDNVEVCWDDQDQLYKIGPFSIDYVESSYKIGNREEVQFAGITGSSLYTNASDESLVRGKDWDFLWVKGQRDSNDNSEFPHTGEEFYITMEYIDGATEITDFTFDFKYMNAGGKYERLTGEYFTARWESEQEENWCNGGRKCSHGRIYSHSWTTGSGENIRTHNCSGGTPCSHGYYTRHVESIEYWIELKSIEPAQNSQMLSLGLVGCRWYDTGNLSMNKEIEIEKEYKGRLTISKQVVDKNGNKVSVSDNQYFEFDIYINGKYDSKVRVKADSSVTTKWYYWNEGESAPTYEIREVNIQEEYKQYSISNSTGTLSNNSTAKIIAKNEQVENHSGKLVLNKIAYGDVTGLEFKFKVTIGDKTYEPVISAATNWTWSSPEITWSGDNSPKYTVSEYATEGVNTVAITPSSGYLKDTSSGNITTVTAINVNIPEWEYGRIEITKKLESSSTISGTYTFKIKVDGYDVSYASIEVEAGKTSSTWISDEFAWLKGTEAPSYTVEEVNLPEGAELISITNSSGKLSSDGTVRVTAVNKSGGTDKKDYSGYLKIDKKVIGDITGLEFKFKVTIGDKTYEPVISAATNWTWTSEKFTWTGDNAPKYTVSEYATEGVNTVAITPSSGYLADTESGNITTVTAINEKIPEWEYGRIEITKKLDGNTSSSDIYTFKVTVSGYGTYYATVTAGSTYRSSQFAWEKGEKAPTYTVEEVDIPEGSKLVSITNAQGSLSSGGTVSIIAINKLEENSGKIKVTKEVITDEKMQNEAIKDTFTISVKINGTFEMNGESVVDGTRTVTATLSAGGTYETPTIKWWGNNSPTYTVSETEIPNGWILDGISNSNGQLVSGKTIEVVVTNSFTTRILIDLTIEMAGKVWNDVAQDPDGKNTEDSIPNGICEDSEEGIDGVEVYIYKVLYSGETEVNRYLATGYEDDGVVEISWPLITQNGGYWDTPRMSVAALTESEKAANYKAKYDVEFVYDGQTYEPTTFLPTSSGNASEYMSASTSKRDNWLKDSMALDYNRQEVDNRIAQVTGNQAIDSNGETIGKVIGTDGTENGIQYTSTDYTYGINDSSRKVSTVVTTDNNGIALDVFKAKARTSVGYLLYPFDDRIHLESYDKYIDELGAVQVYHYSATYNYTLNINLGLVKREVADVAASKDLYEANVVVNEKLLNYRFNSALIELAEKTGSEELAGGILNKQIEIQDAGIEYTLGLYESDFYYRAEIYQSDNDGLYEALETFYKSMGLQYNSTELDVYLTYKLSLYNESPSYDATINSVDEYFDSSFTLVNTTVDKYIQTSNGVTVDGVTEVASPSDYSVTRQTTSGTVSGSETGSVNWNITQSNIKGSDGTTYNKMSTDSLKGIKLASGERVDIYVTFSVNKDNYYDKDVNATVSNCIMLGAKNNIVEIANYTTYYKDEERIAGKIDKESAPANVNIENYNEKEWYEDDTDAAPMINIELYTEDREINGTAWEDKQDTSIENGYGQIVGNGIRDDDESLIGDLTTELVEKVRVLQVNETGNAVTDANGNYVYKEYDFIWPTDKVFSFLGNKTLENLTGFNSTTTTANAANADTGLEEGQYRFIGVPSGNYVVRFTYGDKEIETAGYTQNSPAIYNGQDYKTATYQAGFKNITDTDGDGYSDNEWHDLNSLELLDAKVSDSRDDEARRLEVVAKSKIITNVNGTILETADSVDADHTDLYDYYMIADTAKINLEVENTSSIKNQMLNNGNSSLLTNTIDTQYVSGGIIVNSIAGKISVNGVEKGTTDFTYTVGDIDIALEERSSTELTLDKQVETIKLTTSDNKTILYAQYDITYIPTYNSTTGTSTWEAKVELNEENSIGTDQLQSLNKDEENGIQNFRYINVDETILQGTTIEIGYLFTVLDTGEVDRVGLLQTLETKEEIVEQAEALREASSTYTKAKKASDFNKKIVCGEYIGSIYYQGADGSNTDGIVTTKVHQMIDYVDNDTVYTASLNTGVDSSWRNITVEEIKENQLLDSSIYTTEEDGETILQITDSDEVLYETENKNNIIVSIDNDTDDTEYTNKGFIVDLVPYSAIENGYDRYGYMTDMGLTVTRYVSQETDADDLNFDNIAEVVILENTVGRRDVEAVPGNTNPKNSAGVFSESLNERDTSATELITLTPPTGINKSDITRIQLLVASLGALIIVAVGIVIIKKKVLK